MTSGQTSHVPWTIWAVLLATGAMLGWHRGQLPVREPLSTAAAADGIAPDLELYRDVIRDVRRGRAYYACARERIPQYGFPISSPLNWRLPTYAWLLSRLPGEWAIQAALVGLSAFALALTFAAKRDECTGQAGIACPTAMAVATTCLMFGVVKWSIDGQAYLAQEVWATVLIAISLAALALAVGWDEAAQGPTAHQQRRRHWRAGACLASWSHPTYLRFALVLLAIGAGIGALMFRELALPWCVACSGMAIWKRRWIEAAAWTSGIAAFFGFFAWHVVQVKAQLAGTEVAASAGIAQWLRFGGLDFVLLTTRMNSLLFAAPGWLLWLYLLLALLGLSRSKNEASQTACVAAPIYLLAFAIVGRPENFYWGLMPAALLVWGTVDGAWQLATAGSLHAIAAWSRSTRPQMASDK